MDVMRLKLATGLPKNEHAASIHILEKLGFSNFIETRYAGWDVRLYRLTRSDWKPD
jgi:RimJ/RimL family protein N-acetyltransferase